jgi:hypothetical protein
MLNLLKPTSEVGLSWLNKKKARAVRRGRFWDNGIGSIGAYPRRRDKATHRLIPSQVLQ